MPDRKHIEELRLCLDIWTRDGYCTFGKKTFCEQCAAPYLLWKLITGEILHNNTPRLTLDGWKQRLSGL